LVSPLQIHSPPPPGGEPLGTGPSVASLAWPKKIPCPQAHSMNARLLWTPCQTPAPIPNGMALAYLGIACVHMKHKRLTAPRCPSAPGPAAGVTPCIHILDVFHGSGMNEASSCGSVLYASFILQRTARLCTGPGRAGVGGWGGGLLAGNTFGNGKLQFPIGCQCSHSKGVPLYPSGSASAGS